MDRSSKPTKRQPWRELPRGIVTVTRAGTLLVTEADLRAIGVDKQVAIAIEPQAKLLRLTPPVPNGAIRRVSGPIEGNTRSISLIIALRALNVAPTKSHGRRKADVNANATTITISFAEEDKA